MFFREPFRSLDKVEFISYSSLVMTLVVFMEGSPCAWHRPAPSSQRLYGTGAVCSPILHMDLGPGCHQHLSQGPRPGNAGAGNLNPGLCDPRGPGRGCGSFGLQGPASNCTAGTPAQPRPAERAPNAAYLLGVSISLLAKRI